MAKARQFPRNKSNQFEFFLLKTSRVAVILFSKLASACDFAVARSMASKEFFNPAPEMTLSSYPSTLSKDPWLFASRDTTSKSSKPFRHNESSSRVSGTQHVAGHFNRYSTHIAGQSRVLALSLIAGPCCRTRLANGPGIQRARGSRAGASGRHSGRGAP